MTEVKTMSMVVISLATELGRFRALDDEESRWLERAVREEDRRNGRCRCFWQPKEDIALKRLLKRGRKVRDIARALGRTEQAVWSRIRHLRGHRGHRRPRQGLAVEYGCEM